MAQMKKSGTPAKNSAKSCLGLTATANVQRSAIAAKVANSIGFGMRSNMDLR